MKIYACNWHGYYQSQMELPDASDAVIKNCAAWQDVLQTALQEVNMECIGWKEDEPLCKTVEIADCQYEKWIVSLLYQEQNKPLPNTISSLEEDRLFQKVSDGFIKSELAIMWEPQAYLPVSKTCVFDFADPDEEPMCFGTLKTYCKKIRSLQAESMDYKAVMNVLQYAEEHSLMLILENEAADI